MDWLVNAWNREPYLTLMGVVLVLGLGGTLLLKLTSKN